MKPEVMAPGTNVVSSFSHFYMESGATEFDRRTTVAESSFNGGTYTWNVASGTSMSTPVVGGVIALWLEAAPWLSPDDIRGVLARTCSRKNLGGGAPDNYIGYGEIDAYRGLLDILGVSGISGISSSAPSGVEIALHGGSSLSFSFASVPDGQAQVRIYSAGGALCGSYVLPAGQQRPVLDIGALRAGVYVVQVSSGSPENTGSVLIRKR